MNSVDFQLLDEEKIHDSIIKRDFIKINHQSGANVDSEISNVIFYFGKNHKFVQVGNVYLELDIKFR